MDVCHLISLMPHSSGLHVTVQKFERSMIDAPGPCVLFATPGMLSGGFSVEVFKHWAVSENNLVSLPGYTPILLFLFLHYISSLSFLPFSLHFPFDSMMSKMQINVSHN